MDDVVIGGERVPAVGLGTFGLAGERCREVVESALELGYRHVDTARAYGNERAVGEGLVAAHVDREQVFLTTKVQATDAARDDVVAAAAASLDDLGLDHVDLLLLHWPNPLVPLEETMRGLADVRDRGWARHVGVSNFSLDRLDRARAVADVPLAADQVQFHPYHPQTDLLGYCQRNDVALIAYSPLARGAVVEDSVLQEVGRAHGKTAAQVALRWAVQHRNVAAIPKASSRDHLAANRDVFDFRLTAAEMTRVRQPSRARTGLSWVRSWLG